MSSSICAKRKLIPESIEFVDSTSDINIPSMTERVNNFATPQEVDQKTTDILIIDFKGVKHLAKLTPQSTVLDLYKCVTSITSLPMSQFKLLLSFPTQPLLNLDI